MAAAPPPPPSPTGGEGARGGRRDSRPGRILLALLGLSGCSPAAEPPLVIVTDWPGASRADREAAYRRDSGDARPITWVVLGPGERLGSVLDRRGGVDLLLGGAVAEYGRLAGSGLLGPFDPSDRAPWRLVRRPDPEVPSAAIEPPTPGDADPRDDPAALARAKAALEAEGWARGFEGPVRRAARGRAEPGRTSASPGPAAILRGARSPDRARRFLATLGPAEPPPARALADATADGLLADLLGAALVDAREERRDAGAALARFGHPARAEAALGERPPWPPASITLLRAGPSGPALLETLAEQVAPDPEARAWLLASWSGPRRPIDGDLLRELAGAADGRLAGEPRFRAWLRGEWGAWTRQLYRRAARLAGGYVPS